jgi:hypothetical protein
MDEKTDKMTNLKGKERADKYAQSQYDKSDWEELANQYSKIRVLALALDEAEREIEVMQAYADQPRISREATKEIRDTLAMMCFCKEPKKCPRCHEMLLICDNEEWRRKVFCLLTKLDQQHPAPVSAEDERDIFQQLKPIIEQVKIVSPDWNTGGWSIKYDILKRIKDCMNYDQDDLTSEETIEDVLLAIIQIATYPFKPEPKQLEV